MIPPNSPVEFAMDHAEKAEAAGTENGYYDEVQELMEGWRIKARSSREDGRRSLSELLVEKSDTDEEASTALQALYSTVLQLAQRIATMTYRFLKLFHFDQDKVRVAAGTVRRMNLAGGSDVSPVTGIFIGPIETLGKDREQRDQKEDAEKENRIFGKIFNGVLFLELVFNMPSFLGRTSSEKKNWAEKIREFIEAKSGLKERVRTLESEISLLKEEDLNCQTKESNIDKDKDRDDIVAGLLSLSNSPVKPKPTTEQSESDSEEVGSAIQKPGVLTPDPKPAAEHSGNNDVELDPGIQKPGLLIPDPRMEKFEISSEEVSSRIRKAGLLTPVDNTDEFCSGVLKLGLLTPDPQPTADQSETGSDKVGSGNRKPGLPTRVPKPATEQSDSGSEETAKQSDSTKPSVSEIWFEEVKSFDDFHILFDGTVLDSELSDETRMTYYKLCHTQSAFLHENIFNGQNKWLVLGAIAETVAIADAVEASSTATISRVRFGAWEKSLRAFELLGMNVRFLHARLSQLAGSPVETGVKEIEEKLAELKEACDRFGGSIRSLKSESPC